MSAYGTSTSGVTASGVIASGVTAFGPDGFRGRAFAWCLVFALALAPVTTAPASAPVDLPQHGPSALDLSARWPVLLDATTRTLSPAGGERIVPRTQRAATAPRRRPSVRFQGAPAALPRARRLTELGRRQTDGG